MMKALSSFYDNRATGLRFLLTSRPYTYIHREFRSLEGKVPTIRLRGEDEVEVGKISEEINLVIRSKVDNLSEDGKLDKRERDSLYRRLTRTPNRTYLWVHLICNMLDTVEPVMRSSLQDAINDVPQTVDEAYNKILCRTSDSRITKLLLHMVVSAVRPLSIHEMATSFAILERQSPEDFEQNIQHPDVFRNAIRGLSGLFVVVIHEKIYLIHQTAKEFLVRQGINDSTAVVNHNPGLEWKSCLRSEESNRIMVDVCVLYLNFLGDCRPLRAQLRTETLRQYSNENVLFDYAARYWTLHYKSSGSDRSTEMALLVQRLCDTNWAGCLVWCGHALELFAAYRMSDTRHPSALKTRKSRRNVTTGLEDMPNFKGIDTLTLASYFGVYDVVRGLIARGDTRLNEGHGYFHRTAFSWAAAAGNTSIVQLFLKTRTHCHLPYFGVVEVNLGDKDGQTPLLHAAKNGHDMTVEALLAFSETFPDLPDVFGRTPLSYAAENGHVDVVKILPKTGLVDSFMDTGRIDQNSRCLEYKTPLTYASEKDHLLIVKRLLTSEDVDLGIFGKELDRENALYSAVVNGAFAAVLQILDAGGFEINKTWTIDGEDFTLLRLAAAWGN
ncbi:ankyrin repeat protein, partial [Colletotrichum asianum]